MHIYEIFCNILIAFVEICRNACECRAVARSIRAQVACSSWHPWPVRDTIVAAMMNVLSKLASLLLAGLLCLTIVSMPRLSTEPLPYTCRLINLFAGTTAVEADGGAETSREQACYAALANVVTTATARADRAFEPASTAAQQRVVAWAPAPPLVAPARTG